MRESIGGAWIYGLVVTFVLLFASFLAIAINYTKVFKVKNEVTSIVEKYEGFTETSRGNKGTQRDGSIPIISNYLDKAAYVYMGKCPNNNDEGKYWAGFGSGNRIDFPHNPTSNYLFCFRKRETKTTITVNGHKSQDTKNYYDLIFFFKVDLPVLGDIFTFKIEDQTFNIIRPSDPIPNSGIYKPSK